MLETRESPEHEHARSDLKSAALPEMKTRSKASIAISGVQLRMARAALRWTIGDMAREAKVVRATVVRLESNRPTRKATAVAIRKALERAGVVFIHEYDGDGIRMTYAAQCVQEIIELAETAPEGATIDPAVNQRIDRFLSGSILWAKKWKLEDGAYVRQLHRGLKIAADNAEPRVGRTLNHAFEYLRAKSGS